MFGCHLAPTECCYCSGLTPALRTSFNNSKNETHEQVPDGPRGHHYQCKFLRPKQRGYLPEPSELHLPSCCSASRSIQGQCRRNGECERCRGTRSDHNHSWGRGSLPQPPRLHLPQRGESRCGGHRYEVGRCPPMPERAWMHLSLTRDSLKNGGASARGPHCLWDVRSLGACELWLLDLTRP